MNLESNTSLDTTKESDNKKLLDNFFDLKSKLFKLLEFKNDKSITEKISDTISSIIKLETNKDLDEYTDDNIYNWYEEKLIETINNLDNYWFSDDHIYDLELDSSLIRISHKLKKIYAIFKSFNNRLPFLDEVLSLSVKMDSIWRIQLKEYVSNLDIKKTILRLWDNFEKIKVWKVKDKLHHINNDLEDTIGWFLCNLRLNKKIDEIYLSIYGLEWNYRENKILRELFEIWKRKKVNIFVDPKSSWVNEESIKFLTDNWLNVIIPNKRLHAKFILWISNEKDFSKFLISSWNFIKWNDDNWNNINTEDISRYWKSKKSEWYWKNLNILVEFLKWCSSEECSDKISTLYSRTLSEYRLIHSEKNNKLFLAPFWAMKHIRNKIKEEEKWIYIASTTFFDKRFHSDILDAAKRGVKVIVNTRSKFVHFWELNDNITFIKRTKVLEWESKQHWRIFYFEWLEEAYTWSMWCNWASNRAVDSIFKVEVTDELLELIQYQKDHSKIINTKLDNWE